MGLVFIIKLIFLSYKKLYLLIFSGHGLTLENFINTC